MVHTYDTIPAVGGVSVTGRPSGAMPDCYVDSGFVTPEGEPIFVPVEDMNVPGWTPAGSYAYTDSKGRTVYR